MRFNCYCGQEINLKQKEVQKILLDEELFCSPSCLKKYLLAQEKCTKLDYPQKDAYVYKPSEVYDRVTKQYYRSFYEVYFARFCLENNFEVFYEPFSYDIEGKSYTPDFFLPQIGLHIEIKGQWLNNSRSKYLAAREQINIILLPAYLQKEFEKKYRIKNEIIR